MAGIQYKDETLEVGNIRAGTITTLPDYVIAERDRVYDELLERINKEVAILAFNTDQHIDTAASEGIGNYPRYVLNGIRALRDIAELIPIDIICLGGDTCGWLSKSVRDILDTVNIVNQPLSNIKTPVISIPGNHDAFQNNGNTTAQGVYNVHFKKSKGIKNIVHSGNDNCDSYFDDEDNKIRYIFIDIYSKNVRTESYSAFLTNALSTMGSDYNCIIFSHNPLTNEFNGVIRGVDSRGEDTDAFAHPTDLHSIIDQYANQVIACICGHSHIDAHGISNSGILYIETTTAAPYNYGHFENIPYRKTMNTVTETAYDVFVVNLDEQTIEALRYGQGTNRKWKYKGTGQGLISYTNYLSGTCSVPSVTLNFTDSNSNVLSAVVGSDGTYSVYLELGKAYAISCEGYTLSRSSITLSQNTILNLTLTANK